MSEHPQLTVYEDGVARRIDCSNVIFILVSDIGTDRMLKMIMSYPHRQDIPQAVLVSLVKDALDDQWKRLQFGKLVNEVVPFLPLNVQHITDIILKKVEKMNTDFQQKYWKVSQ